MGKHRLLFLLHEIRTIPHLCARLKLANIDLEKQIHGLAAAFNKSPSILQSY